MIWPLKSVFRITWLARQEVKGAHHGRPHPPGRATAVAATD